MKKIFLIFAVLIFGNFALASDVIILHTSDTHGRISPIEYKGRKNVAGISRRSTFINQMRAENKNVLLLDSGDVFQGSLYYRHDYGKLNAKLLRYLNYDAIALGNHEFDNGVKVLRRNVKNSKTQFLSANVHFNDKYLKKAVKPYIIKEIDGEKYLIIGVTTSELANLSNTSYARVTDATEEIKNIVKSVKYDHLIILSHCGLDEDRKIAKEVPDIDLIVGGHNHFFFETPTYVGKTPIVQDGEFGVRVGILDFDKKLKHYIHTNITPDMQKNPKIDKLIAKTDKKIAHSTKKVIAKTNITLIGDQYTIEHNQTNLGKLVLLSMTKAFPSYDAVMTNSGSIRVNRNIKNQVTYGDVLEILPFENKVVLVELQGKYLKEALQKGQTTTRRYLQYHLNIEQIKDNETYNVITNEYIASGKDGYEPFLHGKIVKVSKRSQIKLFCDLLQDLKIITNDNIKF